MKHRESRNGQANRQSGSMLEPMESRTLLSAGMGDRFFHALPMQAGPSMPALHIDLSRGAEGRIAPSLTRGPVMMAVPEMSLPQMGGVGFHDVSATQVAPVFVITTQYLPQYTVQVIHFVVGVPTRMGASHHHGGEVSNSPDFPIPQNEGGTGDIRNDSTPRGVAAILPPESAAPAVLMKNADVTERLINVIDEASQTTAGRIVENTIRSSDILAKVIALPASWVANPVAVLEAKLPGAAAGAAAIVNALPAAAAVPQSIPEMIEQATSSSQEWNVESHRAFNFSRLGSPFMLLADSVGTFVEESALIQTTLAVAGDRSRAWLVTLAVISADIALITYYQHKRRKAQLVRVARPAFYMLQPR